MAQTVCAIVTGDDRERLSRIVDDPNAKQKHARRALIILTSAERVNVQQVAQRTGTTRPAVWRWQQRYLDEGVEGLMRDKTRPSRVPPLPRETRLKVIAKYGIGLDKIDLSGFGFANAAEVKVN